MGTKYLQHQNGSIAYDDSGSGPLVVCAPSMGDLRGEYRYLIPQLVAAGYRAVSLDVRGHGETSVEWADYSVAGCGSDLVTLIRHLDAGPAVIVGTSMSAGSAIWAAAEAPELVSGLVLIGAFVRGETAWAVRLAMSILFSRPWGPGMWLRYFSTLFPTRKPQDFAEYCAKLRANLAQPRRMEALQKMIPASKLPSEVRIPQVKAPVKVIMGSKDPDFKSPETEGRWVAEHLHGELEMIDGAGHYPHAEFPEITGPIILSFIKTLESEREMVHAA
jgi:pimeloyl-ACP methyl ester carboxylesterase